MKNKKKETICIKAENLGLTIIIIIIIKIIIIIIMW